MCVYVCVCVCVCVSISTIVYVRETLFLPMHRWINWWLGKEHNRVSGFLVNRWLILEHIVLIFVDGYTN